MHSRDITLSLVHWMFILWFGWYGFNGAAATTGPQLASIFMTTTIAPAVATVVCMIFTWVKIWKTRCIHVSECFTCRFGSNHSTL